MLNALLRQLIANGLWHVQKLRGTGHQLSILPLAVDRRSDVLKSGGRGESQLALSSVKEILIKYSPMGAPFRQ